MAKVVRSFVILGQNNLGTQPRKSSLLICSPPIRQFHSSISIATLELQMKLKDEIEGWVVNTASTETIFF
jgi:hypothetical protein